MWVALFLLWLVCGALGCFFRFLVRKGEQESISNFMYTWQYERAARKRRRIVLASLLLYPVFGLIQPADAIYWVVSTAFATIFVIGMTGILVKRRDVKQPIVDVPETLLRLHCGLQKTLNTLDASRDGAKWREVKSQIENLEDQMFALWSNEVVVAAQSEVVHLESKLTALEAVQQYDCRIVERVAFWQNYLDKCNARPGDRWEALHIIRYTYGRFAERLEALRKVRNYEPVDRLLNEAKEILAAHREVADANEQTLTNSRE